MGVYKIFGLTISLDNGKPSPKRLKAEKIAQQIIDLCQDTDGGVDISDEDKQAVNDLVDEIQQYSVRKPALSNKLFGTWEVLYATNPKNTGGPFRSRVGRFLFRKQTIYNVIAYPNKVGNRIGFRTFSLMDGFASLTGEITNREADRYEFFLDSRTQRLFRGQGKTVPFDFSTSFEVVYLDDNLRIQRGSQGNIFVFLKRKDLDLADELFSDNDSDASVGSAPLDSGTVRVRVGDKKAGARELTKSGTMMSKYSSDAASAQNGNGAFSSANGVSNNGSSASLNGSASANGNGAEMSQQELRSSFDSKARTLQTASSQLKKLKSDVNRVKGQSSDRNSDAEVVEARVEALEELAMDLQDTVTQLENEVYQARVQIKKLSGTVDVIKV